MPANSPCSQPRRIRVRTYDPRVLRYRKPPEGLSSEDWWLAIKLARLAARHVLPLEDKNGQSFAFTDSAYLNRMLHQVDRDAGGRIELPDDLVSVGSRDRYLVNSLIEEAITSSQLEGAVTTRRVAKEMLRSRRRPRDTSEQMIFNNCRGMEFLRNHTDEDLSLPLLLELHRVLTEGTLKPDEVGRIRHHSENMTVVDQRDGTIVHEPPSARARWASRAALHIRQRTGRRAVHPPRPASRATAFHDRLRAPVRGW